MNRMLVLSDSGDFREQMLLHWTPIIEALRTPLVDARDAGEIPADADPAALVSMLIAPILVSTVIMRTRPSDEFLEQLLVQTLLACRVPDTA